MQPPSTRRELLSVDDYAARTGISPTEIRRQIRAGTLPAETFQRPQGTYYRVIVDAPEDAPAAASDSESVQAPDARQEPPAATQALVETITGLVERNAALSDRVAELSERAGRADLLAEQLAAERARATALAAERDQFQRRLDAAEERARHRWWRGWW